MKTLKRLTGLGGTFAVICVVGVMGVAHGADTAALERIEKIIKQQQAQIEQQAETIEKLRIQVEALSGQAPKPESPAPAMVGKKAPEDITRDKIVDEATATTTAEVKPLNQATGVMSGNDKVNVQLYGHLNKALLYAKDGNEDNLYVVDNSNSSTRVGINGVARASDDLEAGTRIEVQFQTNPSSSVSQLAENNVGTNSFTKRWFDVYLQSKRFGEVRLGHGSTASDVTSEVDLSGTAVIGYSSVQEMAGGQFFYDNASAALSSTQVKGVFNNMDGLGRDDRILYRTPNILGFSAKTSWISGGASDIALGYAAKLGPVAVAAAGAYASFGSISQTVDTQINGSASAFHETGLNLTVAAGSQDLKNTTRNDATFWYGKIGYRQNFFDIGETGIAVDWGRNNNVAANDDQADSYGLLGVQDFKKWGSEYYLGFRNYKLDRPGTDFNDIQSVMSGVRVKF